MAPNAVPSYQALVDLEKGSPGSPREQLREAARIIGVDLDCRDDGNNDSIATEQILSAPKEEWVLRWLMKKLKNTQKGDSSHRMDKYSWILLRALFDRIPPKSLATILGENKFLSILKEALETLGELIGNRENAPSQPSSEGASVVESTKSGRKRKRVEGAGDESAPVATVSSWIDVLVLLLESMNQLVSLLSRIPASEVAVRSQLRLLLRAEPELAARILGQTLQYASDAFIEIEKSTTSGSADIRRIISRSLLSMVTVWENRSDHTGDAEDASSNDAFILHSLSPALRFLRNLHNVEQSADKQAIVHGLERLVVLHVVLPLRQHFLSLKPTQSSSADTHANPDQVEAISGKIDSKFSPETRGELLPTLFNIAVRSVPRDTFRRQIGEAPWLETLFVVLAARSGCVIYGAASKETKDSVPLLEELVQVAIDRKLGITLKTLAQYVSRFSELLESESPMRWRLISQIIRINVDVFLPNSGYDESKLFLEKLISRITSECLQFSSFDIETKTTIKTEVVIPLLRGFFGARDIETFVQIWKDQLVFLESGRSLGKDAYFYSIWEDDDVLKTYGDLVTTTSPLGHTKSQLETLLSGLQSDGNDNDSSQNYVRVVFLDAFLMSKPRQDEGFIDSDLFDKLFDTISSIATSKDRLHWNWRLWRILQNLVDKFPTSIVRLPSSLAQSVLPATIKSLQSFFKKSKKKSDVTQCREAFCSVQFVLSVLTKANIPDGDGHLNTLISSLEVILPAIAQFEDVAWDGRVEKLESPQTVGIGALTVLLANPSGVTKLSSENRRQLFTTILSTLSGTPGGQNPLSSIETSTSRNIGDQLAEVWDAFVSPDWLLAASPAVYDLVNVICTQFTENKGIRLFLLGSLLKVPARLIPAHLRVTILDILLDTMVQEQHFPALELGILSLLKRLIELPKSFARIITEWDALWKIAGSISSPDSETVSSLFHAFHQLQKAVVGRIMISSESSRQDYMQKTADKLSSLSNISAGNPEYNSMGHYLFCLSLHWIHANQEGLDDNARAKKVHSLRVSVFEACVSDAQSLAKQIKKRPESLDETVLTGIINALNTFPDECRGDKSVRKAVQRLDECLSKNDAELQSQKLVKRQCIAWLKPGPKIRPEIINYAPSFPIEHLRAAQQSSFVHEIRQQVSSMSSKKLVEFVRDIREAGFTDENAPYQLMLVGVAVLSFPPIESRESPEAVELSSLFTALANSLSGFASIEPFCLAAECIDLLLRTHPKSASQWNIDNLFGAISVATSHSGPQIPREFAGAVYNRLCRLLGTVFGLYRKKLSGRFHLILPPLQRLLRCLFTRDSRAAKSAPVRSELPPWIGNMDDTPLHADHAGQFCRLLTSLCDPTVSAVQLQRASQANQGLSDSTKKVKSLAGQYLQYLIMEYTGLQLRGHLSPEMKAALMPGVYSVLDVMSRTTMRAMNAAMDSSSRAIFKGLYDDYMRFGKWDQD